MVWVCSERMEAVVKMKGGVEMADSVWVAVWDVVEGGNGGGV